MHRIKNIFAVALISMFIFVGCGNEDKNKIVLRFSNAEMGQEQIRIMKEIISKYEEQNPSVKIKLEWGAKPHAIITQIAGGSAPDVFMWWNGIGDFVKRDALLSLTPYVNKYNIDLKKYWKALTDYYTYNDNLYAFPLQLKTSCILYNKDMFDKEGVKYPSSDWTWDDYLNTAKKFMKDTNGDGRRDQFGTLLPLFYDWAYLNGGKIVDEKSMKCVFNSSETKEALQYLKKLFKEGTPSPSEAENFRGSGYGEAFLTGQCAMLYAPAYMLQGMKPVRFKWDVAPLPKPPKNKKTIYFDDASLCVSNQTKYPEEAFKFVAFYCGEIGQKIFAKGRNGIPALKEAAYTSFLEGGPEGIKYYLEEGEIASVPVAPKSGAWLRMVDILFDEFDMYKLKDKDVNAVVKDIESRINEALKEKK